MIHTMIVSPTVQLGDQPSVNLNGEKLDVVRKYNYLGVIKDDDLTFSNFLNDTCNKVNVSVHQLSKLRKLITGNIACLIYKQTILPISEYADQMVESGPT